MRNAERESRWGEGEKGRKEIGGGEKSEKLVVVLEGASLIDSLSGFLEKENEK